MGNWHSGHNATNYLLCYVRGTIFLHLIVTVAHAEAMSFDYPNFAHIDAKQLDGDASVLGSDFVIQFTRNAEHSDMASDVGRVTGPQPIHLWDKSSKQVNDFSTNFSFIIVSNNSAYGDGLAFFLASPNIPKANDIGGGGGLGLQWANQSTPFDYSFVAVEFDTFKNAWDPDGTHVGVNVNSQRSNTYIEWSTDIPERKIYNSSIQYSSINNCLNVSFTGYRYYEGPVTQYLAYHIDLRENLPEYVIVGISAATGGLKEEHTLLSWSFSTSLQSIQSNDLSKVRDPKRWEGIGIGIGIGIGLCLILLGLMLVLILLWVRRKDKEVASETYSDLMMDDEFQRSTRPKKISYYELVTATNNFEETQKLGQGGFGGVYKGYLKESESFAAIKRISTDSKQGLKQYTAEVKIISQLRHKNLVQLTGWCHRRNDLLLIYEYMPNGSLDSHLFRGESMLSWQVRYNIALGLASALFYLQEEWEKCVLHRDIKSSNIMLDSNFSAKLGDFGLARLVDHEKGSQTTDVAGTKGYLAPEYVITGKARKESDIFSFGVVLLEVGSGRKAIHHKYKEGEISLVEWVWKLYELRNLLAAADPKLCGEFDVEQMERLLVVGLWCANPDCKSRPSIWEVIKVLNFEDPLPILIQNLPVVAYFPPTTNELFLSVSSSFQDAS